VTARTVGLGLAGVALLGHLLVTAPAQQAGASAADRYQQLRREKRDASRRVADLEKKADLLERTGGLVSVGTSVPRQEAIQRVRSATVKSLQAAGVTRVRLEVRPAAAPATAFVSLQAEASFADQLRLLSQLLRPGSGVVLVRVTLTPLASILQLHLEAAVIGDPS
jgi:hypothetical protein